MKHIYTTLLLLTLQLSVMAQGWPSNYGGVMLQGFSWDSFTDTQWTNLERQADELSAYFSLIWVPQSGNCNTGYNNMGYTPVYYFNHNSSFGAEQQLRSMIQTFKQKGTGIVADVVVNHRNNLGVNGSWVDYPAETYQGITYQMTPQDITYNDDGGNTRTWAMKQNISLSQNYDEGEDWNGCRDLDHQSDNVQKTIKAYVKFLTADLGYTGFRYDMVKGFKASHVGDYNDAAGVQFSVGEYWDGNERISAWIDQTGKKSGAFDFQFRYAVRDAINNNNWTVLATKPYLAANNYAGGAYRRWAVTFVENHDMQDRGTTSGYTPDALRRDTLAANAFLLAMPGTPCVFLPHWKAYKQDIKAMIDVRKALGIVNTSSYSTLRSDIPFCAMKVAGQQGSLIAVVGPGAAGYTTPADAVEVLSGYHYRYLATKNSEQVFADKASGVYDAAIRVRLAVASADPQAVVVYTLDGTQPTASSPRATHGTYLDITQNTHLTMALLSNGKVSRATSRQYTIQPFVAHQATVYFKDPGWSTVKFYAWDGKQELNGPWSGKVITDKTTQSGATWYYQTFNIPASTYSFNIIFNNGTTQTVDIGPITGDSYYELGAMVNGKYTVSDLTKTMTGIRETLIPHNATPTMVRVYTLDGRLLRQQPAHTFDIRTLPKGFYIVNGEKVVVR